MTSDRDIPTLLTRPGEKPPAGRDLPAMRRVSDPGPPMPRTRRFFRPWRLIGKAFVVTVPCWLASAIVALGGWFTGLAATIEGSLVPIAEAGMNTALFLALLPAGVMAFWAGVVAIRDLADRRRYRRRRAAYDDAIARQSDPDIITATDLRSPGVRSGLRTLAHLDLLLGSVARERGRISSLMVDTLGQSRALVYRSVLDLVGTERRIAEWSGRLGGASAYLAKLMDRRDALTACYAGILDQCLHAADRSLAGVDDPVDLQRSVDGLLESCQRALDQVERTGPAVDEAELLLYAAKAREQRAAEVAEGGRSADRA